ncbi:S8 family serine peptidase, partial [Streptomyces sp. N35]|uniref:S8 family peptidase n=1 Tax=Streptomyces sp. N35 TaxID=2795730 RepID=UPI001F27A717
MSTIAVAATVVCVVGLTVPPATAVPPAGAQPSAASVHKTSGKQQPVPTRRIQLITGDRVTVDDKGDVIGMEPAKGREKIPVQVRRVDGHTLVVPVDTERLIAAGKLDSRLFDVTEPAKAQTARARTDDLRLIVGYRGAASAAKSEVREAGATEVRRTLKSLNADALSTPKDDAAALWAALTDERAGGRTTASGINGIWLDGVREATLDTSVRQIGADKAWAAGYDGKGVKIAILDTGVDASHADLQGKVVAAKNFSAAPDATDKHGHGTHVASIAAGTGAASGGTYKGVAPGAELLSGKVLDDDGYGTDSGILAGIDWAVGEGADIVNLSLGGPDSPGTDPLEAAVNTYAKERGVLFAIASGNVGPRMLGSPGSADAALTVGAVDGAEQLAGFSSTGPRVGDGAIKPDVTAPGVDITAAAAPGSFLDSDPQLPHPAPGYLTISGTSMATPHVAGAAALLKQQHPNWTYQELKGVLTGSAKGGAYTPFEQGAGRIQVEQAMRQSVFADPVSLTFGVAEYPHADDPLLTEKLTYKNLGATDVTLDLSVSGLGPEGEAAPAGFFALGADQVTVPAGGTASVDLTADTRLGGTLHGAYTAYVTASGGGPSVRTAAAVQREAESYDVTIRNIGRDGQQATYFSNRLVGTSGPAEGEQFSAVNEAGDVTLRVPKGDYVLNADIRVGSYEEPEGIDWIAQPKLSVTEDTTVTVDARQAKPVDLTAPGVTAPAEFANAEFTVTTALRPYTFGWMFLNGRGYTGFRTAHLGPEMAEGLTQTFDGHFVKDASSHYSLIYGGEVPRLATGWTKRVKMSELAALRIEMGSSAAGKRGAVMAMGFMPGAASASAITPRQDLPGIRTVYVSTHNNTLWQVDYQQQGEPDEFGDPSVDAQYNLATFQVYEPGRTYRTRVNHAVFGPKADADFRLGVFRKGNEIYGHMPLYSDGEGHEGFVRYASVKTELYRNGTKIGENDNPLDGYPGGEGYPGEGSFEVPADEASYALISHATRDLAGGKVSSRLKTTFTFRSKEVAEDTQLPVSVARFAPALALDGTAPPRPPGGGPGGGAGGAPPGEPPATG